jgi:eukaryotic translation initiation factor 2C
MNIQIPLYYHEIKVFRGNSQNEEVRRFFERIVTDYKDLDMIFVIYGGKTTLYNTIKTCGDISYGVPTQGVKDTNIERIKDQTLLSNILLKMNTKLGGHNWFLARSNHLFSKHLQKLYEGPLMIFGADVTHPSPTDLKVTESIAAVVGSLDMEASFYAARLFAQKTPNSQAYEMIHDLDKMVLSLLQEFHRANRVFPRKIVMFRDGVSEGQFSLVQRWEMNKIRLACKQISNGYEPAITFILVQKRHHTRFFPVDSKDMNGRAENVPPGTVVDRTIVSQTQFDYFLCSHVGIQGTSRPCRYYVLHDDNNFSMDQIQLLSHYLCHVYSRCARSVSYPAPAYYAHLAAFRGRDYIRRLPNSNANQVTSYEIELHSNIRNEMFFS